MSFLTEIKGHVKEYAEIIAAFVDCEVEIVDENMLRIAATGKFERLENKVSKGAIYKDVLVNGESHVVENPSRHPLCSDCEFKDRCQEKLEIAAPIIHNDETIGVIGIVALTDIIKSKVLRNISLYLEFTEQISDFISETIVEFQNSDTKERTDILCEVIDNFDKYAVVIDNNDTVIAVNDKAAKELKLEEDFKNVKLTITPTDDVMFGKKVFSLKTAEKEFNAAGILVSVSLITKKPCRVLFFNKYRG